MSFEKLKTFTFNWKIKNYSKNFCKTGEMLDSPKFCPKNLNASFWCIRYFPTGIRDEFRNYVSCYLCRGDSLKMETEIVIDFKLEMIDSNGKVLSTHIAENEYFRVGSIFGRNDFMSLQQLADEMKEWTEDILTIRCCMTDQSEVLPIGGVCSTIFPNERSIFSRPNDFIKTACHYIFELTTADPNTKSLIPSALQKDLKDLLVNQRNTDVQLKVGDKIYSAHKTILIARSPVFDAMLNQDFIENQTGVIDILDVDEKIFEIFLKFLYTETVDNMDSENVANLLMVANKYQVMSLENECLSFLNKNISKENVCAVLILSDMVGNDILKLKAVNFFMSHASEILPSSEWSQLMQRNVRLATEVLAKLTNRLKQVLSK